MQLIFQFIGFKRCTSSSSVEEAIERSNPLLWKELSKTEDSDEENGEREDERTYQLSPMVWTQLPEHPPVSKQVRFLTTSQLVGF